MSIILKRIIELLKEDEHRRTITVGNANAGGVSYILREGDIKALEKAIRISELIEMIPIEEWIRLAVKELKK